MDLELPFGPWKRIASGQWAELPVSIYSNPQRILLIVVFEKQADEVSGMLVLMNRVFSVEGDLSKFSRSQRREMVLMQSISQDRKWQYLLVGATPIYSAYSLEALTDAVKKQFEELDGLGKVTKEIVSSYGAKARDFSDVSEEQAQWLLGNPLLLFSFSYSSPLNARSFSVEKVLVGIDRLKQDVSVSLESLRLVTIIGEKAEKRLHALHVLAEACLLDNVPVMVFDSSGALAGLGQPSKDPSEFEKFKMNSVPLGFPFKEYKMGEGLFVDLAAIDSDLFLATFGLETSDVAGLVKRAYDPLQKTMSVLAELATAVGKLEESKETPRYLMNKAARVIQVIQKAHPGLFAKNLSADLVAPYQLNNGKVIYINLFGQPPNIRQLVIRAIVKSLENAKTPRLSLVFLFSDDFSSIPSPVAEKIDDLSQAGFGFVVQAEKALDLESLHPTLAVELVAGEAVVKESGKKAIRFTLRPGYSQCTEARDLSH